MTISVEPTMGMQCTGYLKHRDHSDWRKKHESQWRGPPVQHELQNLEAASVDEPAEGVAQVLLFPE